MKHLRHLAACLGLLLALPLAGCYSSSLTSAERGALIGAGVGSAAGAIIDDEQPGRGAVVGAAVGALGGYVIGDDHDHRGYDECDPRYPY